jgi:hypothetical protein
LKEKMMMKWIAAVCGLLLLIAVADLRAENYYPAREYGYTEGEPEHFGPPPAERPEEPPHRGSRRRYGEIRFQQFRREVRVMGEEARDNLRRIEELEEQLSRLEPGPEAESIAGRLAALQRRQAELRLELARKKVAFTLRALEVAERRYQQSLGELERVREIVVQEYPDLADLPPVE